MPSTIWERFRQALCKLVPSKEYEKKANATVSTADVLVFLVFGTLSFFNQEMLYTAAEDILSGRKLPTASIFVTFITPLMAVKILCPWFIQRVPYLVKTLLITTFMIVGILIIVYAESTKLKLLGIAMNAMATGASELVFLSLTSFYPQICISSFVAGTGLSSLVAPLYYTGVTTWSCVPPKTAILITAPWSILIMIAYAILNKEPIANSPCSSPSLGKRSKGVSYEKIESDGSSEDEELTEFDQTKLSLTRPLDCKEKGLAAWKIFPFMLPLFFSFFAEYLITSSVVTTVSFPGSGIRPRDHYLYYSLSYRIGKFVGRSYLFFISLFGDFSRFLLCRHTWIFALINLILLMFFALESWYHFVPGIGLIIVMCSAVGLVSGLIVLHSPHAVASVTETREREFAFGLLTLGNAIGAFSAGLVGLEVEPFLQSECKMHFISEQMFCFTRHRNATGWSSNIHC